MYVYLSTWHFPTLLYIYLYSSMFTILCSIVVPCANRRIGYHSDRKQGLPLPTVCAY